MKTLIFSLLAIGTFALTSCKENKEQKNSTDTTMQHNMSTMSDSAAMGNMAMNKEVSVTDAKKTSADLTDTAKNRVPTRNKLHCTTMHNFGCKKSIYPIFGGCQMV